MTTPSRKTKTPKWTCSNADRPVVEAAWRALSDDEWLWVQELIVEHSLGVLLDAIHCVPKDVRLFGRVNDLQVVLARRKQEMT